MAGVRTGEPGVFAHPNSDLGQAREWLREPGRGDAMRCCSRARVKTLRSTGPSWPLVGIWVSWRGATGGFVDSFSRRSRRRWRAAMRLRPKRHSSFAPCSSTNIARSICGTRLLPPALLPDDWVGSSAYDLCANLYAKVFTAAEEFLTGTASTLEKPLPAAAASAYDRFGGPNGPAFAAEMPGTGWMRQARCEWAAGQSRALPCPSNARGTPDWLR